MTEPVHCPGPAKLRFIFCVISGWEHSAVLSTPWNVQTDTAAEDLQQQIKRWSSSSPRRKFIFLWQTQNSNRLHSEFIQCSFIKSGNKQQTYLIQMLIDLNKLITWHNSCDQLITAHLLFHELCLFLWICREVCFSLDYRQTNWNGFYSRSRLR